MQYSERFTRCPTMIGCLETVFGESLCVCVCVFSYAQMVICIYMFEANHRMIFDWLQIVISRLCGHNLKWYFPPRLNTSRLSLKGAIYNIQLKRPEARQILPWKELVAEWHFVYKGMPQALSERCSSPSCLLARPVACSCLCMQISSFSLPTNPLPPYQSRQ